MPAPSDPPDSRALADSLDPETLPRLAFFIGGYLRDDVGPERRSAAHAAFDYAAEAELDELQELEAEWQALRHASLHLPLAHVNEILRVRFGSVWQAGSREEIDAVARELERASRE